MSIAPSTNKRLQESLKIKSAPIEELQPQIVGASSAVLEEPKNNSASVNSFVDELRELKKKQKKARLEPVMTHLRPDVNEALENLVEQTGLTKSKVVAQIIMKTLGLK